MPLVAGTRLGSYEILTPLGAGGMGEVYRARDTRLQRDVAIKVLPDVFAADPDRLARFQREAQVLASLNHPNIAHIHGLEESGPSTHPASSGQAGAGQAPVRALVMELVEGPTLADRIARGPIPPAEALPIAKQIAEALEAAHEQGIIHRDLKPANIKVREDGTVKVLDFGLAKLTDPVGAGRQTGPLGFSQSPTLTTPAATLAGVVLGTAAYMAPEQARGKVVDKRADVWAFGCVLFEMLTATRAFAGDEITDTLAFIITKEPDWARLPASTAPAIRRLLRRCLEKDPKERLRDIADAGIEIKDAMSAPASEPAGVRTETRSPRWRRLGMVAGAVLATGVLTGTAVWRAMIPAPSRVSRLTMTSSGAAVLTINGIDPDLALTPDGTHVVYVGNNGAQLFVRALDAIEPAAIATGIMHGPFVSPDGRWVGFFDNNNLLKKVAITGGPPITVARVNGVPRGATWAPDDTIIFATASLGGLQRVSASGGMPEVLTSPAQGEADHIWPEILPGGGAVLFTITSPTGGLDAAQVTVRDLRTGMQQILVRGGSHARYVTSGHLVYTAAGTLRAVPFDPRRLETRGTAVPVVSRLVTTPAGAGDFAVANDGTLVYVEAPAGLAGTGRTLAWVDRMGKEEPIPAPPRAYTYPRLSPDGMRVALDIRDQENDVWVWDLRRARLMRLTIEPGADQSPVWTPDGRRLIFSSNRAGVLNLWWQAADGTGDAKQLTTSANAQNATGIAPDGTSVVFYEQTPATARDLLRLTLDGDDRVTTLLQTKFDEQNGGVSPDGRWLAYQSDSSGPFEIYVRPFPNAGGGQWQVSTAGGRQPLWARSGKELFYVGPDGALMRVPVEATGATWNAGTPIQLFEGRNFFTGDVTSGRTYGVSPDGRRFLMIKVPGADSTIAPPNIIVVQHWADELKRLVPTTQ